MGVNLRELLTKKEICLEDLRGKTVAVDAFNTIFQFLSTIRTPEGALLTDSKGNVTSHLIGLLSRTSSLVEHGINPVFVFDGTPPKLKAEEIARRKEVKVEAHKKYEEAAKEENIEEMKKYASRTSVLTEAMLSDAKKMLSLMGIPVVQAPSEAEAQAAHIVKQGNAWAVASQDYDSLLYATPFLVQNLSIAGRKKKTKAGIVTVKPELTELSQVLKELGVNQEQLICLAMLVGTDYNQGGVKGVGPKTALKIVKEHKKPEKIFAEAKWDDNISIPWQYIFELFTDMPVTDDYKLKWDLPDEDGMEEFLVNNRGFSQERIAKSIEMLSKYHETKKQKNLGAWFG